MKRSAVVVAAFAVAIGGRSAATQMPAGISRTELLDNPTVMMARLRMEPGSRETIHTHPFAAVVMQLTPGEMDMTIGKVRSRQTRDAGFVWFVPKEMPHAAINSGSGPVEFVTVAIKPARPSAPAAPPTAARPGITRDPVLDNDDTRVVRVTFAPGSREPMHTHPNDLVTIQITPGRMEIEESGARSGEARAAGFTKFIARGVEHSYANVDAKPIELLSVAIK